MAEGIIFIQDLPEVALDANGATLSYYSGETHYIRRYPRYLWRRFIEIEMRRLNAFEIAERAERNVVEIGKAGH